MKYIRFNDNGTIQAALLNEENELFRIEETDYVAFYYALKNSGLSVQHYIERAGITGEAVDFASLDLVLPIQAEEVWASGVTYQKSKEARNYEATVGKEHIEETFYDKVYDAERPEIFFKSTSRRLIGPAGALHIRSDSNWQIPEPELTLIVGEGTEIIGYTLGNDMSCRDIEGENPLYLPQAKIWKNSCSIGPAILLPESVEDPYALDITCRIFRDGEQVFEGSAYVNQLKRKLDELVHYLVLDNDIAPGTALMTGTCIVPPNDFTLQQGDLIEISSASIGALKNPILNS